MEKEKEISLLEVLEDRLLRLNRDALVVLLLLIPFLLSCQSYKGTNKKYINEDSAFHQYIFYDVNSFASLIDTLKIYGNTNKASLELMHVYDSSTLAELFDLGSSSIDNVEPLFITLGYFSGNRKRDTTIRLYNIEQFKKLMLSGHHFEPVPNEQKKTMPPIIRGIRNNK